MIESSDMKLTKANKQLARSTAHRDAELLTMNFGYAAHRIEEQIKSNGYSIRIKRHNAPKAAMTTTDAITRTIWCARDWENRSPIRQVVTLAHELVHVRQANSLGVRKFATRYLMSERWRWILEMQAYAESIAVARQLGFDVSDRPEEIANIMARSYGPWLLIPKAELKAATVEVLRVAL